MKFITEEDLRDLFKKEPFTTYEIKEGERLTPGARQFLLDRKVNISENSPCIKKNIEESKEQPKERNIKNDWKKKLFHCKIKSTEALFLMTAQEILSTDIILAQNIINLGKEFSNIRKSLEKKDISQSFCFKECTGIKVEDFSQDLDDCFEITEFHIQLEKGRDIIILHKLRCALRELEPFVLELFENNDSEYEFYKDIVGKVNQSINALSQIICSIIGGKICQRKS